MLLFPTDKGNKTDVDTKEEHPLYVQGLHFKYKFQVLEVLRFCLLSSA